MMRLAALFILASCPALRAGLPGVQLAADSPFYAGAGRAPLGDRPGPYELRGIMSSDEGTRFCIFDSSAGRCQWAGIGETGLPFIILSGEADGSSVTLERVGRRILLKIRMARIASAPEVEAAGSAADGGPVVHARAGRPPGASRAPNPPSAP